MGAVKQWAIERLGYAEQLYVALEALVGDVESVLSTEAGLHWCSPDGVEGSWRETSGQFWLERCVWTPQGRHWTQLGLVLDSLGDEPECIGLADPMAYRFPSADGTVVEANPAIPQTYAAALALLIALQRDLRGMLWHLGQHEEASPETECEQEKPHA
jgi:hypothetical protein